MNESFLHHLWKAKLFHSKQLLTSGGDPVEIIKTGQHNCDAGPDFFNARIKIGNTTWAGNVEIHMKSSDWKNHAHENDLAYDNVILHVVFEEDEVVKRKDGSLMPTIRVSEFINPAHWKNYQELLQSKQWIPCQQRFSEVDAFTLDNWLDRLVAERLERKTDAIISSLRLNKNNWEETFYQHLAKNFGFRLNAVPFELLAKSLPLAYLAKHKSRLKQLEAMLFGQAGMLEKEFKDDYPLELQKEYLFLRNKFRLTSLASHQWKFLRLRPANFPTIRIAQFAQLVLLSSHLFSRILEIKNLREVKNYFRVEVSEYWNTHFVFDKSSRRQSKRLGDDAVENIVINTIVPFLFAYGTNRRSEMHRQNAVRFLEETPSEKNAVIANWKKLNVESGSAYRSQALLQLRNEYCSEKKCLTCSVGNKIISLAT